jgi:hypothetical protein
VTASNYLGVSNTSDVLMKPLVRIPFSTAFVDYPAVFPVAIALYDGQVQPWTGSPERPSTSVTMHLSGWPLIRGPWDLSITVDAYNISAEDSIRIVTSSVSAGTELQFLPFNLPDEARKLCGMPCEIKLKMTFVKEPSKQASFSLSYFAYPTADILFLMPTAGPIAGGTVLNVQLMDFIGPFTREGAQVQNLLSVYKGLSKLSVIFQVNGNSWNGTVLGVAENTELQSTDAIVLDVSVKLPRSVEGEGVAEIRIEIDDQPFDVSTIEASLHFEYVGTKMVLIPSTGLLNPGSGGMEMQVSGIGKIV